MAITDEMIVKFSADISDLKAGLDDVKTQLAGVGDSARNISLIEAGESIKGFGRDLTQNVTVPILGLFSESITAASKTEEAISKFAVIFDEFAAEGETWITKTAGEMSRSESQIRDYAAAFGALLSPAFKDNKEKALELSEGFTTLAVDLAAFHDTTDDEAFTALRAGLTGEMEPLKRFGVILSQDKVEAELMTMGVGKVTSALTANQRAEINAAQAAEDRANANLLALKASGKATEEEIKGAKAILDTAEAQNELVQLRYKAGIAADKAAAKETGVYKRATEAEKAQARYNIVMRDTIDSQGQAVREGDGFAQSMKRLEGTFETIKVAIGEALMPVVMTLVGFFQGFIDTIKNLDPGILRIGVILAGLVAVVGPVLVAVGALVGMFGSFLAIIGTGGVMAGVSALMATLAPLVVPVLAVVGAVALLVGAFVGMWQASETFRTAIGSIAGLVIGFVKGVISWLMPIKDAVVAAVMPALAKLGDIWGGIVLKIVDWIKGDGQGFVEMLGGIASVVRDVLIVAFEKLVALYTDYLLPVFEDLAEIVIDYVLDALGKLAKWFKDPETQASLKRIGERLGDLWTWLEQLWTVISDHVLGPLADFFAQFDPDHESWIAGIVSIIGRFYDAGVGISQLLRGDVDGALKSFGKALGVAGDDTEDAAKDVSTSMKTISGSTDREMKAALKTVDENAVKIKGRLKKEYEANVANVDEQMRLARLGMENELGLTADTAEEGGKAIKDRLKEQYVANVKNADQEFDAAKKKIETRLDETDKKVVQPKGQEIQTSMANTWSGVNTDTGTWWGTIRTTVGTWVENVRLKIDGAKQGVLDTVGRWWAGIESGVWNGWVPIVNKVSEMVGKIVTTIDGWKASVAAAAQRVWQAAQDKLAQALTLPGGGETQAPAVRPAAAPGIDINNPVAIAPSETGGRWYQGHYIAPGANGYWDKDLDKWVQVYHSGGVYEAPGGRSEGLAWLQTGERVLSRPETAEYDRARRAVTTTITINNPTQRSARETLAQANAVSRKLVRRVGAT